jgi:hypothetical protein
MELKIVVRRQALINSLHLSQKPCRTATDGYINENGKKLRDTAVASSLIEETDRLGQI